MADNLTLNAGSGGATLATALLAWSGDSASVQVIAAGILSGSEGSWTFTEYVGGAGAVTAGTQRITLASNDPAVALLTTIDADTSKIPSQGQATMAGSTPVVIASDQTAVPVSGTVTANLSATDNAVLDAIAASLAGALTVNSHAVTNAGTFAVQVTSAPTTAVTGTFWQATQPVSAASLPLPAGAATEASLSALGGKVTACNTGAVVVASGSITADLGATDNAVLDTIASPVETISATPLQRVAIFDDADAQITSFGGGTQYTEGDTDATITGTAVMWEDAANTLATVSAGSPLPVAIISGAGSGGTASDDDADFTAGTTAGTPAMGVYESSPTSVTDGDMGIAGITATRALRTVVEGTVTVDMGANNDVTLAVLPDTAAGDLAAMVVDLAAIEVLLGTIDADTSTLAAVDFATGADVASLAVVGGGAEATALRVTIANDSTGVVTVDGTVTAELSGTDNAVLDDIAAKLATIDADTSALFGTVSGSEQQVDIVAALPAGTNTIGGVIGQQSTSVAYDGTTACTIKRATGLAASGTVAMVAAVSGKKIRCLALSLLSTSTTATNVYIANDDNDILGDASNPIPLSQAAAGDNVAGFVLPWNPGGWFETDTANEALNVVLSAAQDVIYALTYIEVA